MKTLNFYIFRKVAYACFLSVSMFTFVLLLGTALNDAVRLLGSGYLDWYEFLGMLMILIPYIVSYALPLGMLTGVLLVLGKLSAQNEITAMRCAGLSLWRISTPILAIAFLGVSASIMINNYYAPNANSAYKARMLATISGDPLKVIVEKTFIREFPGLVLYIREEEGNTMKDFWIWQLDEYRNVKQLVRAKTGDFHYDGDQGALILTLYNGYAENRDSGDPDGLDKPLMAGAFEKGRIKLPIDRFFGRSTYSRKLSQMNFNDLLEERANILTDASIGTGEKFEKQIRVQAQVQQNFALAYSVLAFTFLAIPLGIKVGRTESYANIMVALGLAFVYYFAFVIIGWLEKNPAFRPDLIIWIPNICFQILGFYLFNRVSGK